MKKKYLSVLQESFMLTLRSSHRNNYQLLETVEVTIWQVVLEIFLQYPTHNDLSNLSFMTIDLALTYGSLIVNTHLFFKLNLCGRLAQAINIHLTPKVLSSRRTNSFPDMLIANLKRFAVSIRACLDRPELQSIAKQVRVLPSYQTINTFTF